MPVVAVGSTEVHEAVPPRAGVVSTDVRAVAGRPRGCTCTTRTPPGPAGAGRAGHGASTGTGSIASSAIGTALMKEVVR